MEHTNETDRDRILREAELVRMHSAAEAEWQLETSDLPAMNRAQRDAIRIILISGLDRTTLEHVSRVEVKTFDVRRIYGKAGAGTLSVVVEIGWRGDEGTAASIFCRERGHWFIGPRGAITVAGQPTGRDKTSTAKLRKYPTIYGWGH